jgi:hypothetical protein
MAKNPLQTLAKVAISAVLLASTAGCAYFDIGNPILPKARLRGEPANNQVKVKYTLSLKDRTIAAAATDTAFRLFSTPGDGGPGVTFYAYSAEYFDMNNKSIPSLFLAKTNFGITKYIPPFSQTKAAETSMVLPVYNQQVRLYGDDLAFLFVGGVELNRNFSHTISASVTLYGEDDNLNQVEVRFNCPIVFEAEITQ